MGESTRPALTPAPTVTDSSRRRRITVNDAAYSRIKQQREGPDMDIEARLARRLSGAPNDLSENDITAWMRSVARLSLIRLFSSPMIFKDVLPVIVQVNALFRAKRL